MSHAHGSVLFASHPPISTSPRMFGFASTTREGKNKWHSDHQAQSVATRTAPAISHHQVAHATNSKTWTTNGAPNAYGRHTTMLHNLFWRINMWVAMKQYDRKRQRKWAKETHQDD